MKVTEELQIIIDEAEVSAIGESTDENKRVLNLYFFIFTLRPSGHKAFRP